VWVLPYSVGMALAHVEPLDANWVPRDSFGVRLAMIRIELGGLNVKKAAEMCGINDQSWRNWEAGGSTPRDYETITAKIAAATGCDLHWLRAGGDLRSRCSSANGQVGRHLSVVPDPPADPDQGELF
jgi:DNA-binding XRE family transcriptional regulator